MMNERKTESEKNGEAGQTTGMKARANGRKKTRDTRFFLVCLLVFFVCVAVDLVTKAWAEFYFADHDPFYLIPGFMRLTFTYNSGMAFSFLSDNPTAMTVITWMTLPIMLAILAAVFFLPKQYNPHRMLASIVAAGAMGNFLDRVFIEAGVRDFMDISSIGFGTCNFADYFVTIGGVLLLLCLFFVGEDALIYPLIGGKKGGKEKKTDDGTPSAPGAQGGEGKSD